MRAIDCTNDTRPYIAKLKAAGVSVVIRYVGTSAWKCLSKPEADALKKAGLGIACVYETTVSMMDSGGKTAGSNAAIKAKAAMKACGVGPFCYFTCDEDVPYTSERNDWLAGAAQAIGKQNVGVYASGSFVAAALKAGHVTKGWRSLSTGFPGYGLRPKGLVLLQFGKKYGSIMPDYDADDMLAADVGQWGYSPTPVPAPTPSLPRTYVWNGAAVIKRAQVDQWLRSFAGGKNIESHKGRLRRTGLILTPTASARAIVLNGQTRGLTMHSRTTSDSTQAQADAFIATL
jgi:hypothetical protein